MTLVASIGLGMTQNRLRTTGKVDPISMIAQRAVAPGSMAIDGTLGNLKSALSQIQNASAKDAEIRRLRLLERSALTYTEVVESLQAELNSARATAGMPNFGHDRVSARIIGYFPYENRVTLSAGAKDGIAVGMPVVCGDGLFGTIETVADTTSQALTVAAPRAKFGAMVAGSEPVLGIIKGQTPRRLALDVVDPGTVQVGDLVVTSGFSDRVPRGIPIGTVAEVVPDPNYGTRRIFVVPAIQIARTLDVWVLK